MKKKSFTLIELLVVIAVIGILAAMLMPALNSVRVKGKVTKAKSEMNAIITAIKQYEADYGVLPLTGACTDSNGKVNSDANYNLLMEFLTGVDGPDSGTTISENPRKIRYLDTGSTYTAKGFVDPFGKFYTIYLDIDYDGKVSINGKDCYGSVFLYSWGSNTTDNNGESGSSTNDDIASWK